MDEPKALNVALYLRVSTDRQAKEGDSLEEQESELKKFCDYRGYHIHKTFIERGKSGGSVNRPQYQSLLGDVQAGKIEAVIVKKIDRLSRSLMDFEQFMTLLQAQKIEFISLRENFDTTTAMGKAMVRVALVFAQLEREQTAERIKDVFTFRAEQGMYNGGTRPFGYDSLSSELVPHKLEKQAVQFIFKTFLETKSSTLVAQKCNAQGFLNRSGSFWDKRQVHKILIHPVYTGKIRWNGILSNGIHQPLVTDAVFEQAQAIFRERRHTRVGTKIQGLLKGFLVCEICNGPMTPNYTQKKNKVRHYYYRCVSSLNPKRGASCKNYPRMEDTHQAVFACILNAASEEKLGQMALEIAKRNDQIQAQLDTIESEIQAFEHNLTLVQTKKEKYLDSLIANTFTPPERQAINEKIIEFGLQEKQLKAQVLKAQLTHSEIEARFVGLDAFKQELVFFKVNHSELSMAELQAWFKKNIQTVLFAKEALKIHFKLPDLWIT